MPLAAYRRKRDFTKTPEPKAAPGSRRSKQLRFVIQKHDASHLHYDFRLEWNGALVSWAVPKGPSLSPADKRLAVHVEDHPIDYRDFEGVIPQGQYGGGTVIVWDRGTWTPLDADPAKALKQGRLTFELEGQKLRGAWTLTRMRGREDKNGRENWLLIKRSDAHAREDGASILEREPASAKSGRTLDEVAAANGAAPKRRRTKASTGSKPSGPRGSARAKIDPGTLSGARASAMPKAVSPQLCTLVDEAPDGDEWLHEIKLDGYRLIARKSGDRVALITRTGKDWTTKFPSIEKGVAGLPIGDAILDGEVVILDSEGRTSFAGLPPAIKSRDFGSLVYYVFDAIYAEGYDLMGVPVVARKELVRAIVPSPDTSAVRFSEHVVGSGPKVHKHACALGLEGIISKRADAPYVQERSRSWVKVKCSKRQEFVIIGWTPPGGSRHHFGALLVGAHDASGTLVFTGRVGTGFDARALKDIRAMLERIEIEVCPAANPPTGAEARGVRWVRPELVAEIEFTGWTEDAKLRHPAFQGIRQDKDARSVKIETAVPMDGVAPSAKRRTTTKKTTSAKSPAKTGSAVVGVVITHPDRVLYPDVGVTKIGLAQYYEAVADRMLPHLVGRPVSVVRCPQGATHKCFFQKHLAGTFSDPVRSIRVREKQGSADYIAVDSLEGLVALVQFGVIEIHPWGSRQGTIETPDVLTFDLDPGEGASFDLVKAGTAHVREILESLGLRCFLKTTGGKGLHVVVPVKPEVEWNAAKAFCFDIARAIAAADSTSFIATASKERRRGRVYIDYLRNARGGTAIAPYSARSRPGAPVAMPLAWEELRSLKSADRFTVSNALDRLEEMQADPWKEYGKRTPSLRRAIEALERHQKDSMAGPATRRADDTKQTPRRARRSP